MNLAKENITILVVDDSEPIRILLRNYLQEEGYRVNEAVDGITGIDSCLVQCPDLILLDIAMPNMDGFSMFEALQKISHLRAVPVIMLSANNSTETKMQAFQLGVVDYITKPFNHGEVIARIKTHLTISQLTLSLQQANQDLLIQQDQLLQGLHAAADLQKSLLPKRVPNCKSLKFASYFRPCEEVGGDIYNVLRLDDEHLAIYLVDVSGHGFSAAMMTALITQALSRSGGIITKTGEDGATETISQPDQVLRELDQEFPIDRFNLYMTIVYLVFNTSTATFRYSSAGHPPPIHISTDGVTPLDAGGPPVGMGSLKSVWENGEGKLAPGDRLFFFTDGITEQGNQQGQQFTEEGFIKSITEGEEASLKKTVQNIARDLKLFTQSSQFDDDVTILAIEKTKQS